MKTTCSCSPTALRPALLALACVLASAVVACGGGGGGGTTTPPTPPPVITTLTPNTGSTLGGTTVAIAGTGFSVSPTPTVTLGGLSVAVSGATAAGFSITTPAHAAGAVNLVVTNPDGQAATSTGGFTYVTPPPPPAPAITLLSPTSGVTTGGTTLTVTGTNFVTPTVFFGATAVAPSSSSSTQVQVVTPAGAAGPVNVTVHNADGQVSNALVFTYVTPPPPAITLLSPSSGPTTGGTTLTLTGSNFVGPTVFFGATAVVPSSSSSSQVQVVTPAGAAGPVNVTVQNADGQPSNAVVFTYQAATPPAPVLTSLSAIQGSTAGGTTVTVTGTNFLAPASVFFGTTSVAPSSTSNTQLQVIAPAGAAGPVNVTVHNADGQVSNALVFTYVTPPAPVITTLSVTTGATAGGTTLTVNGTDFVAPATVLFGATAVAPISSSTTALQVITPAGAAGPVNVTVRNPDLQVSNAVTFTYVAGTPPPAPATVSPASGRTAGGQTISISGSNFSPSPNPPTVTFGGVAATVTNATATVVTVTTPAHAAGAVSVAVTNPDNQSASLTNAFTYVAPPSLTSIAPTSGGTGGNTSVVLTGSNFAIAPTPTVLFGTNAVAVTAHDAGSITVTTSAHAAGATNVTVRNPDNQESTLAGAFTFNAPAGTPPTVTSVFNLASNLPVGSTVGSESVVVTGTNFVSGAQVTFGNQQAAIVSFTSPTRLDVLTPLAPPIGTVDVTVTLPGGLSGTKTQAFTFLGPAPVVTAFSRPGVPAAGGGVQLIKGSNLGAATTVKFGTATAPFVSFTSGNGVPGQDQLVVTIPPSPLLPSTDDFVDIVVTNPDGQSFTFPRPVLSNGSAWPGNFHYGPPPAVTGFNPGTGKGISVTLTGTLFSADSTGFRVGLSVGFSGPSFATLPPLTCPGDPLCPVGVTSSTPTTIVVSIPSRQINPGPNYCFIVTNFDAQFATICGYVVP